MAQKLIVDRVTGKPVRDELAAVAVGDAMDALAAERDPRAGMIRYGTSDTIPRCVELLTGAGLPGDELLRKPLALLGEARMAGREAREFTDALGRAYADARNAFAAGKCTHAELLDATMRYEMVAAGPNHAAHFSGAVKMRTAQLYQHAEQAAGQQISGPVWSALDKLARDTAAATVEPGKIIKKLLGNPVHVAEQHRRQAARDAGCSVEWSLLGDLVSQWDEIHRVARELAALGWIEPWRLDAVPDHKRLGTNIRKVLWAFTRYAHPELLPNRFYDGNHKDGIVPELRLPLAVVNGAEPGLYTVAEGVRNAMSWIDQVAALEGVDRKRGMSNVDVAFHDFPGFTTDHYLGVVGTQGVSDVASSTAPQNGPGPGGGWVGANTQAAPGW